jgi:hypothetical protein
VSCADGGEASLHLAAVRLHVYRDNGLDGLAPGSVEVPQGRKMLRQRARPVAGPRLKSGDELNLVDQAVLEGKKTEEQVTIDGDV